MLLTSSHGGLTTIIANLNNFCLNYLNFPAKHFTYLNPHEGTHRIYSAFTLTQ